jgi:hypothetical protein
MRGGHELSGAIEALVGGSSLGKSTESVYISTFSCDVQRLDRMKLLDDCATVRGEGLAATRTLRFSPKGALSYSVGIETDQKVSPLGS